MPDERQTHQNPSQDPADSGSLAGLLKSFFGKMMQDVHVQLPAAVVSYDRQSNTAAVRPLIQIVGTGGQTVSRAQIARVPVLALGGGGFVINYPLKAGDLGWIEASDRDISAFMQHMGEAQPQTDRTHEFSDSRFIPDIYGQYVIGGEDTEDMVIQTLDGATKIVIRKEEILIKTPKNAIVDAGQKITLKAAQSIALQAPQVTVTGNLSTGGGTVTMAGNIATTGTLTNNGKNIGSTHTHTGVQTGSGTTGQPS
jgi:hypothetical protein